LGFSDRILWIGAALFGLGAGSALARDIAQAPPPPSSEVQQQYEAAFQETLRKPADLDVLFHFATLAAQTGDLEGAISALERMLLIDPDLPRVRLELGVLYYRLGSYEVSRTYFEGALKAPNVPPDVRAKAEQFMADAISKQNPSHFSGEAFFGWRYQSNANLGPSTSSVRLFGQTANLNQGAAGAPDWGIVSSLQVRHVYDFGRQDKAALETQFTVYANRQFTQSQANVTLLDLTSGPRFQVFANSFEDMSVRPFLSGGYIWVNDTPYYGSYGGGIETSTLLGDGLRGNTVFLFRRHENQDTAYLPTNSQFRGTELSANSNLLYALTPRISLFANGNVQRFEADTALWQSYQLFGAGGGFAFRFPDPVLRTGGFWTFAVNAAVQWWKYDSPDPTVDPGVDRYQNDTILNLTASIPFDDRTTLTVSGGRFNRTSSVPNYAFTNNSFLFGVSWRF
jgi:tetratricopeptide (TPR) repeat protein